MNEYEILRFVLDNAVRYEGKADIGSAMGIILGAHPELRSKAKKLMPEIKNIVDEVNKLSLEEQKAKLNELGDVIRPKKIEGDKVPVLNVDKVVVRFAPNPNGALSFGHCRPALWNWFIKERYGGKYILRFDDTDPKIKKPIAKKIPCKTAIIPVEIIDEFAIFLNSSINLCVFPSLNGIKSPSFSLNENILYKR